MGPTFELCNNITSFLDLKIQVNGHVACSKQASAAMGVLCYYFTSLGGNGGKNRVYKFRVSQKPG